MKKIVVEVEIPEEFEVDEKTLARMARAAVERKLGSRELYNEFVLHSKPKDNKPDKASIFVIVAR